MRVLVVNPNSSLEVTKGIAAALVPFGADFDVVRRADGPETISTDADVAEAAEAFAAYVAAEAATGAADGFITACFSDPGLDLARSRATQPVVGVQEAAVLEACALAERFGVIALSERAIPRHLKRIEALGCLQKLVAELPLNDVSAADSGHDAQVYGHVLALGAELRARGAEILVLGCAGMAQLTTRLETDLGMPVIDPVAAAGRLMLSKLSRTE